MERSATTLPESRRKKGEGHAKESENPPILRRKEKVGTRVEKSRLPTKRATHRRGVP